MGLGVGLALGDGTGVGVGGPTTEGVGVGAGVGVTVGAGAGLGVGEGVGVGDGAEGGVEELLSGAVSVGGVELLVLSGVDVPSPNTCPESLAGAGTVIWPAGEDVATTNCTGVVLPSLTVSCAWGEAKECQLNVVSETAGAGRFMLNPVEFTLLMSCWTNWSMTSAVTIG
jgi:hypothetical protein